MPVQPSGDDKLLAMPMVRRHIFNKFTMDFLLKIWKLASKYRLRLFIGVVAGIISGLMQPLLIATIVFVVSAVFPANITAQSQSSVSKLPQFLQTWFANVRDAINRTAKLAVTPEDGYQTIKLLEMARQSTAERRTIPVSF